MTIYELLAAKQIAAKPMKTQIEIITPRLAEAYLTCCPPFQRKVRSQWVDSLSKMIKEGSFLLTHQGIAFDVSNNLIDGQHRLLAIIQADKNVEMMVTRNVSDQAWHGTDQGVVRKVQEFTTLNKRLGETCRFIAKLLFGEQRPSAALLEKIGGSKLGRKINEIYQFTPTCKRYYSQSPMLAMAALRACTDGGDYAKNQYRALVLQDYDLMSASAKSLCRQVNSKLAKSSGTDLIVRAFKVFDINKQDLTRISITDDEMKTIMSEIRFLAEPLIQDA